MNTIPRPAPSVHKKPSSTVLEAALDLARKGYRVFPVKLNKKPVHDNWTTLGSSDENYVRKTWDNGANYGIGVVTGKKKFVTDLDNKNGKNGSEELSRLEAEHGALPRTPKVRTPTGGYHLWLCDDRDIRNSASKIAPGIDVRGNGGYVVAPPSKVDYIDRKTGEHVVGQYEWVVSFDDCEPARAPDWLVAKALAASTSERKLHGDDYVDHLLDRICANDRWHDNTLALVAHLVGKNFPDALILALAERITCAGHTVEETRLNLKEMISSAHAKWDAENRFKDLLIWSASENRANETLPPLRKFMYPLVYEGARVTIAGPTGVGKTMLALALCRAMATAAPFLGYQPGEPARVLFIDYEVGRRTIWKRLQRYLCPNFFVISIDDPQLGETGLLPIDTVHGQKQVLDFIEITKPDVLVVDNLYHAVAGSILGGSEKNGAHDKVVPFRTKLSSRYNVASIFLHHTGRDPSHPYGDSRLEWGITSLINLEVGENRQEGELRVKYTEKKMREEPERLPFTIVLDDKTGGWETVAKRETVKELTQKNKWMVEAAEELLRTKGKVITEVSPQVTASTTELRNLHKNRFYPYQDGSGALKKDWSRTKKVLKNHCFTVTEKYFWKNGEDFDSDL